MTKRNQLAGLYVIVRKDDTHPSGFDTCYVGSSFNLSRRFTEHKRDLKVKAGKHKNRTLQDIWDKFMASIFLLTSSQQTSVSKNIDAYFSHAKNFEKNKQTAVLVFIPLSETLVTDSLLQDSKAVKEEIISLEPDVNSLLETNLSVTSANIWLVLGTTSRPSQPVCVDGVVYFSRPLAAQALGLLKADGKPNDQIIYQRMATRKWETYFYITDGFLEKKLENRAPSGQLTGYTVMHYGEVRDLDTDNPQVIFWDLPELIREIDVERD